MTAYRPYHHQGQDEYCLCFGLDHARRILIIPPLFDEMNRVRRMLVEAMRLLDARGVGSILIDLPGCNESLSALETQDLVGWRDAVAACAQQLGATHSAALRGGALLDDVVALPRWRLAPVKGASLLKILLRTRIAGEKEAGRALNEADLLNEAASHPIELAGNVLGPTMVAQLQSAIAEPAIGITERRLGEDIVGAPLWLRAEPQDDAAMSANIAADLDRWSAQCGG